MKQLSHLRTGTPSLPICMLVSPVEGKEAPVGCLFPELVYLDVF